MNVNFEAVVASIDNRNSVLSDGTFIPSIEFLNRIRWPPIKMFPLAVIDRVSKEGLLKGALRVRFLC